MGVAGPRCTPDTETGGFPVTRCLPALVLALVLLPLLGVRSGTASAAERSAASILMYHRFGEADLPSTNIRLEQFRAHVATLAGEGFTVLPLPEVVAALRAGRPLPDRAVAITVDDAFASVHDRAWPILRQAGMPFTVFVATGMVGAPGYMTWDDLREMAAAGVTIGAHGDAHAHMPALTPAAQKADMDAMQAAFETHLGQRPSLFAYPYGEADAAALALAEASGFDAAFGQHSGVATSGERFYLPRFALNEHYGNLDRFRRVAAALPIPAEDLTPDSPTIGADANPPRFGFTVTDPAVVRRLGALTCFGPDGQPTRTEILGPRVEVRLDKALPPGRGRVNCTLPGSGETAGRWHWRGTLFVVPGGA
jgi:peptidoglycan/xylan/chitin deacetylase (PgdA/CDA1 family)